MSTKELTPAVVPIINPKSRVKEAYDKGYDSVSDHMQGEGAPQEMIDVPHTDTMPVIRAIAGNGDRGHGTYTESNTVAVEAHGRLTRIETQTLVDECARAYSHGVRDALEGNERKDNPVV